MKIVTQANDEMVIKEGNISSIIFGLAFIFGGLALGAGLGTTAGIPIAFPIVFVLAFSGIGLGMVLLSSSIVVNMQKTNGQITYQKKNVIGGKVDIKAISDVLKIQTRRDWQTDHSPSGSQASSSSKRVLMAQTFIVFKDGQELPIDHKKSAPSVGIGQMSYTIGGSKESSMANDIATFLGVPFEETGTSESTSGITIG